MAGSVLNSTTVLRLNFCAKLNISHASKDCDFTAKLVAVDKEDNAWNITDGITRMSSTKKQATAFKDADGNIIYEIEIDLGHIVFQSMPRWSFRLEIAGSNFPKFGICTFRI